MKKLILFILITVFSLIYFQISAGNLELFNKPPRYHTIDQNGEVLLKLKKAIWIYDCQECHNDFKTQLQPREMVSEHQGLYYDHIKGDNWCFSCHYEELEKRNRIRLVRGIYKGTGDMVKLCSQCHGEKKGEWEIGIHGKVYGRWQTYGDVKVQKKSCEECHSPHHPRSIKVKPFPGPRLRFEKNKKTGGLHE
jgi:hypothetical protein